MRRAAAPFAPARFASRFSRGRLLCLALLAIAPAAPVWAQSGGAYAIRTSTIDAGGARAAGGSFVVTGTVGQSDAEPLQPSVGGTFTVTGGFWAGAATAPPIGDAVFSDGFEEAFVPPRATSTAPAARPAVQVATAMRPGEMRVCLPMPLSVDPPHSS